MKTKIKVIFIFIFLGVLIFLGIRPIDPKLRVYITPSQPNIKIIPLISAGQEAGNGYRMAGKPDGLGAWDNGDGTFTVLMNHELAPHSGRERSHGARGAFISRLTVTKPSHPRGAWKVLSGEDAIKKVFIWDVKQRKHVLSAGEALSYFCSADLAAPSAFYFSAQDLGVQERIYLTGEENDAFKTGKFGRAWALIARGEDQGSLYELPGLGDMAFENLVASPYAQEKTIVMAMDDAVAKNFDTLGEVYVYVGTKRREGLSIEKAGLAEGILYGVSVEGLPIEDEIHGLANQKKQARFSLQPVGGVLEDDGKGLFANTVAGNALGVTKFFRPEDGAWHTSEPGVFYFTTTGNKYMIDFKKKAYQVVSGRLWRLRFDDIHHPDKGGIIERLLDKKDGIINPDNLTVDRKGRVLIQEDPIGKKDLARIWEYNPIQHELQQLAQLNPDFFTKEGKFFLTQNEESSGIIDVSEILGEGSYLASVQAHVNLYRWHDFWSRLRLGLNWPTGKEIVEDGQLSVLFKSE